MQDLDNIIKLFESSDLNISKSNRGMVFGCCVNDAPFPSRMKIDGKKIKHPAYLCWYNMLVRCFCENEHKSTRRT